MVNGKKPVKELPCKIKGCKKKTISPDRICSVHINVMLPNVIWLRTAKERIIPKVSSGIELPRT